TTIRTVSIYAFNPCPYLKTIIVRASVPPNVVTSSFPPRWDLVSIKVPSASLGAYKAHQNWGWYQTILSGY
ncbi:MAG: hypothetical protein AB1407_08260, partial [Spirochaetota bacterium]